MLSIWFNLGIKYNVCDQMRTDVYEITAWGPDPVHTAQHKMHLPIKWTHEHAKNKVMNNSSLLIQDVVGDIIETDEDSIGKGVKKG